MMTLVTDFFQTMFLTETVAFCSAQDTDLDQALKVQHKTD